MKLSKEELLAKYQKIKDFLFESEELSDEQKESLQALFNYLDNETPWMSQLCSTKFHNSYEGGLLEHSVNVTNVALKLKKVLAPDLKDTDVIICALLHDCGKYNQYIRREPTERQRQYGYPGNVIIDPNIPYMEHEDRSLWVITKFYPYLTEEMFCAIAQHNEPWLTNTCQFKSNRLMTILQNSDYWCCLYVDEPEEVK